MLRRGRAAGSGRAAPHVGVDGRPQRVAVLLLDGIASASARLGATPVPPATLIGVAALAEPDILVEVEATAVID